MTERPNRDAGSPVSVLITLAAVAASVLIVATLPQTIDLVRTDPAKGGIFLVLSLVLQLFSVEVYGKGSIGVSAIGLLAAAFSLGPGPAVTIAFVAACFQFVRRRGVLHRALFDAANFSLSTGAAALVYQGLTSLDRSALARVGAATLAGVGYGVVNNGLLCTAMSLSESLPLREVWRERFHWARFHVLAFGPLAVASSIAYDKMGFLGVAAFALPPAMLVLSVRQYLDRTRAAVEDVRAANRDLSLANGELEARNADLHELFEFSGGLSSCAHDRAALLAYAEDALERLTGVGARVAVGPSESGIPLIAGGTWIGTLELHGGDSFDDARWGRLRDAIVPQLSTALESAELVEKVRKTHLATIAALSRSMEAKDYYTGHHTERVSAVAVALAARLGYEGLDRDAIEVGALLHDIGKIGIPERILHKPGPLDDEEWKVIKEHPVISEYILSGVDLPPIVLQIARSSHERYDGAGYPDGLAGERIPMPARIVLVADAFDALTSDRPYRRGRSVQAAMEEMRAHAGSQFCSQVVAALERIYREQPGVLGAVVLRAVEAGAA